MVHVNLATEKVITFMTVIIRLVEDSVWVLDRSSCGQSGKGFFPHCKGQSKIAASGGMPWLKDQGAFLIRGGGDISRGGREPLRTL